MLWAPTLPLTFWIMLPSVPTPPRSNTFLPREPQFRSPAGRSPDLRFDGSVSLPIHGDSGSRSTGPPRQRVVGAGVQIKLKFEAGLEQRARLEMEGVRFRGKRVDMAEHQHRFRTWEFE